jgi:hypothetical protein
MAVDPVDEVDRVGDADDPQHGQQHREGAGQLSPKEDLDVGACAHQQQRGEYLHQQPEEGRQSKLVVDEAGHDQERPAQQDGEHLYLHVLDDDGAEEGGDHQGYDHGGKYGQAAGVGERLLVEPAGIRFVGPTDLQ